MEPEADPEDLRISLAPCPHYRMVGDDRAIACGIHAKIVRNLLGQVPGPLELDRLQPYVEADRCQILLRECGCPGAQGAESTDDSDDSDAPADPSDPAGSDDPAD